MNGAYYFQDPNNGLDLVLSCNPHTRKLTVDFGDVEGSDVTEEARASRLGWQTLARAFTTTDEAAEAISRYAPDITGG